ncbi:hypothetical protein [Pseudomonas sp. O11]|uniref:hypothetical protein n=2 Tax=unclassified Pseudomonas TaxID=196821 RepID=UPI00387B74D7
MQLLSSLANPFLPAIAPDQSVASVPDQPAVTAHTRSRRDTANVTDTGQTPKPKKIKDAEVPKHFIKKISDTKVGPAHSEFMQGFNRPSAVVIPGYSDKMSALALMRLALSPSITPEQVGALTRLNEQRFINTSHDHSRVFSKELSGSGVKVTPMPQGYYLSVINQLSEGECAGISHLLSLAVREGKQHIFLGNIYQALAYPDKPESQVFFRRLAEVQLSFEPNGAHDPTTSKDVPYTAIAPELTDSPTTKTMLISSSGHRITAGVIVGPDKERTYYFSDPNGAFIEFSSKEAFDEGLKKVFTSARLKGFNKPINDNSFRPQYQMSVFNPHYIRQGAPTLSDIRFMYDAPLAGLDDVKVIDASVVPTPREFGIRAPAPAGAPLADYQKVSKGLEKLHESKGMSQFHDTVSVLEAARQFTAHHPDSSLVKDMKILEQTLLNVINEAAAPVGYPYAFERMEKQRADLPQRELGAVTKSQVKVLQGVEVDLHSHIKADPDMFKVVIDAVDAALLKLSQHDPQTFQAVGREIKVIIASPGDQAQTQLRITDTKPTLIIGDDFFTYGERGDSVADRVGIFAGHMGDPPLANKQAASLAGLFGTLGYYKADPKGFLEVINNKQTFQPAGPTLSARAGRNQLEFVTQAFTARLYDGSLDKRTTAELDRIFAPTGSAVGPEPVLTPPPASGTGSTPVRRDGSLRPGTAPKPRTPVAPSIYAPPPLTLAHVNEAVLLRLQKLDDARPLINVGEKQFSRVELYKMGYSINGKPVENPLVGDPEGRKLAGAMHLDYPSFQAYLKWGGDDVRASDVFTEIASQRSVNAPPMINSGDASAMFETLQTSARDMSRQAAEIREMQRNNKPLPADFFSPGSPDKPGAANTAGLGFQAFSTFQGVRSAIDSFNRGDTTAGAISLGAVAADYAGMGLEAGLNNVAQKAVSKAAPTILSFQTATIGKMIGKVAGTAGTVFSAPFDVVNAVDSFKKAGQSTGKEAQDHYVNGAFSVANAATSIALTAAYLAGFSAAGPAGLIVAGVLMSAQAIYSAVRTVENINEHTPLTGQQKFSLGTKAFLGFEPGFDVMKPFLEAKIPKEHEAAERERFKKFLEGPGKDLFERVVFGSVKVEVTQIPGSVGLTGQHWWAPITYLLNLIKVDGTVTNVKTQGGNDRINAPPESWNGKLVPPVEGVGGEKKATLWDLGDGDDTVSGVQTKPNYFSLGGGKKLMSGGEADDTVIFTADARQTLEQARQVREAGANGVREKGSEFWGGDGRNTLIFSGELNTKYTVVREPQTATYLGHVIDFKTGTIAVNTPDSNTHGAAPVARFHSFSNAATVENGESFVQGDDQSNMLTLNGKNDTVLTGKGANVIVINGGASVVGQGDANTYIINKAPRPVTINDPADSVVRLDYSAAQVRDWGVTREGDLVATLNGDVPGKTRLLTIKNAYPDGSTADNVRLKFITDDGVMMMINAPRKAGSSNRVVQVSSMKVGGGKPEA